MSVCHVKKISLLPVLSSVVSVELNSILETYFLITYKTSPMKYNFCIYFSFWICLQLQFLNIKNVCLSPRFFFGGGGKKNKKTNCTHTLSFIFHTLWIKIWFGQYGVDIQIKKNKKKTCRWRKKDIYVERNSSKKNIQN